MAYGVAAMGLLFIVTLVSGCVTTPDDGDVWAVVHWTCGDAPYPMGSLLVLYDSGRSVHLLLWQEDGEEREVDDLSHDEAMVVFEQADATGVVDLDRYRPRDGGEPFFPHREEDDVAADVMDDLRRKADAAGFPTLEPRYVGSDEETEGGHTCGYTLGVRHGDDWPTTYLNPRESAGPEDLRTFLDAVLATHLGAT